MRWTSLRTIETHDRHGGRARPCQPSIGGPATRLRSVLGQMLRKATTSPSLYGFLVLYYGFLVVPLRRLYGAFRCSPSRTATLLETKAVRVARKVAATAATTQEC